MTLPDPSAFKCLIHCPAEPDIFWSDRYHNINAEEKIFSAALKGLYLKDSVHFFEKKNSTERGREKEHFIDRYFICLSYFQEVLWIHSKGDIEDLKMAPCYYQFSILTAQNAAILALSTPAIPRPKILENRNCIKEAVTPEVGIVYRHVGWW